MTRKRVVSQKLEQKIYDLIHQLLDERTQAQNAIDTNENSGEWNVALAKDLRIHEVVDYVQLKDMSLRRMKRNSLENTTEVVLKIVREHEEEEMGDIIEERERKSNSEEEENDNNLMEAKDTNSLNKSIVDVWGFSEPNDIKSEDGGYSNDGNENKAENKIEEDDDEKRLRKRNKENTKASLKRQKSKVEYTTPEFGLSSLGGLEGVITQLMELIGLPILHLEIYKATGVEPPRGVLLYGPPGCGKTTIALALAGELKVPFISISAPSVVSGMSGESEKKLREIFNEAKNIAPCIVFIDEIDAITPKRDGGAQREMERRIVAQLLTIMDELSLLQGDGPVIVIGATNRPDSLDTALRRAGRFDREICLNVPSEQQRCSILKKMSQNLKLEDRERFKFLELAKMTPGYVGADLKSLVTAAGTAAIKRIFESLSEQDEEMLRSQVDAVHIDSMDVDRLNKSNKEISLESEVSKNFGNKSEQEKLSTIQRFLVKHPEPLTEKQLEPLSICYSDFINALPNVQPTAKREGFATVPDVTWKNVGALSHIRMELHMCIVQPIKKPELFMKVGITAPAGVLMWGPPGCGKTLLAKAVANESRANFISIKGPELLNKYVGESERAVRQVFQRAKASVPCIIFFDELDALVPKRDTSLSESSSRVVNTLLTELDGLNDRKGIYVIGATNRPDMIDSAMLRPGRLDKTLYIELPTSQERLEILTTLVNANDTPLSSDVNLKEIAEDERCRNFSGADLSSLIREAGVLALRKKFFKHKHILQLDESGYVDEGSGDPQEEIFVTLADFEKALSHINPSVSDKDRLRYDKLNKRMGWSVISGEDDDPPPSSNTK